jgi:hypothetical protein
LRTGRDSDCHPPPRTGGGMGVCTGPDFKKQKRKIQQKDFSFFFSCLQTVKKKLIFTAADLTASNLNTLD